MFYMVPKSEDPALYDIQTYAKGDIQQKNYLDELCTYKMKNRKNRV